MINQYSLVLDAEGVMKNMGFGKKKVSITPNEIEELKELLLPETNRDDAGIFELATVALGSDMHKNKITRARELVEKL